MARADYMSWLKEDYTISMNVLNTELDDAETQRHIKRYTGSEKTVVNGMIMRYEDENMGESDRKGLHD